MTPKSAFLEPSPTTQQLVNTLTESTDLSDIVKSIENRLIDNPLIQHSVRSILNAYCATYFTDLTKNPPPSYSEEAMVKDMAMVAPEIAGLWLQLRFRVVSLAADWLLEVCESQIAPERETAGVTPGDGKVMTKGGPMESAAENAALQLPPLRGGKVTHEGHQFLAQATDHQMEGLYVRDNGDGDEWYISVDDLFFDGQEMIIRGFKTPEEARAVCAEIKEWQSPGAAAEAQRVHLQRMKELASTVQKHPAKFEVCAFDGRLAITNKDTGEITPLESFVSAQG